MNQDNQTSSEKARRDILNCIGERSRRNQGSNHLFDERVNAFLGINGTDGRCLDIIERHGRIPAGQLATESGLTTGAVTTVIDRLEAAGYVARQRDSRDRRKIWIEVTPQMQALTGEIFGVYDLIGPIMMSHFTDTQLDGILAFLEMGILVHEELAADLAEHTRPGAAPEKRLAQARSFRNAAAAVADRLRDKFAPVLPPKE